MPTGVALRDVREQLFAAAERVLLRAGPSGLTSRSVTEEAGVAKGVLHRHFADFDAFLADLVRSRIARIELQSAALCDSAGTGTVEGNLADALTVLFGPVAVAIVGIVTFRDDLRHRLREARPENDAGPQDDTWAKNYPWPGGAARPGAGAAPPRGIPVLAEAAAMLSKYLAIECELGRIAADADTGSLAVLLIGAGHLLFGDRQAPPAAGAVNQVVAAAVADVTQRRLL